jgi:hypothetical protein
MLAGMVIDARVFSRDVVSDRESRKDAEYLLGAVLANGVILTDSPGRDVREMVDAVAGLDATLGQQIQILATAVGQNRKRLFASVALDADRDRLARMRQAAIALNADMVVCAGMADKHDLADLAAHGIEVVSLSEFQGCEADRRRIGWLQAVRLDRLEIRAREDTIGRALRYTRRLTIVDRYFGLTAKDGRVNRKLSDHARGVAYLAGIWKRQSPYAKHESLDLELVTAAGATGAAGGFVDPSRARTAIFAALQSVSIPATVNVSITFKQDSEPQIMNDRFIEAKGRCWGVRHGTDSFGHLMSGTPRPTFIDPASNDNLSLVSQIRRLDDAR